MAGHNQVDQFEVDEVEVDEVGYIQAAAVEHTLADRNPVGHSLVARILAVDWARPLGSVGMQVGSFVVEPCVDKSAAPYLLEERPFQAEQSEVNFCLLVACKFQTVECSPAATADLAFDLSLDLQMGSRDSGQVLLVRVVALVAGDPFLVGPFV